MCGRFCLTADLEEISALFHLKYSVVLKPRYNIAPNNVIPVIRKPGELEFLTWGLRPNWLKEGQNSFINARIETLEERPAFKQAIKQRRCLIVANGYFEWKQIGTRKQPYHFFLPNNQVFAFAGIYDGDTCAIITAPTWQKDLVQIHQRMPLVLPQKYHATWLDSKVKTINLHEYLQENDITFNVAAVSTKVNNPTNDFAECIKALH